MEKWDKNMLKKPTPDIVQQMFNYYFNIVEQMISKTTGEYKSYLNPDLDSEEEAVFVKISQIKTIFQVGGIDLKLGDIYEPKAKKIKLIIKILFHFLEFIEYIHSDLNDFNELLEKKKMTSEFYFEKDKLLGDINSQAKTKKELLDAQKQLKIRLSEVKHQKELDLSEINSLNKIIEENKNKIKKSESFVNEKKTAIVALQKKEQQLKTECEYESHYNRLKDEYSNLLNQKQLLEKEYKVLYENLTHKAKIVAHMKKCLKIVPNNFFGDLFSTNSKVENDLEDKEIEQNEIISLIKTTEDLIIHKENICKSLNKELEKSELEYKEALDKIKHEKEFLLKKLAKIGEFKRHIDAQKNKIVKLDEEILNLELKIKKVRQHFSNEYTKNINSFKELSNIELFSSEEFL